MKSAIVVSTPDAEFEALAFKETLTNSIKKVASIGYDGVEIAVRDPSKVDVKSIVKQIEDTALEVPAIGTGQAFIVEGLSLSSPESTIRKKAIERLRLQVEFAANFGAMVILGLIRGSVEKSVMPEDAFRWLSEGIRACAEYGKEFGVDILIEPINRYEVNFINTVDEAMVLLKSVDMCNVFLLLDTFHMNIEEADICESIRKAGSLVRHFHVADSNRWAPGFGHIDFAAIRKALMDIGYSRYISAEILPKPDPDTASKKAIETIKKVFFYGKGDNV